MSGLGTSGSHPFPGAELRGASRAGAKPWVLAAVASGTFMSSLNSSSVNAVMPVLVRELRIGLATAEWVTMIFLVLVSGLLLTFGRLGDMFGHKRIYLGGFGVFVAGALACGLARTAPALIAARAAQAVGSAMILSNAPAILLRAFGAEQRGRALGIQATCTYLGLMLGPWVGGWLTEHFGWQAAFLAAVPAGVAAAAISSVAVETDSTRGGGERFDVAGAAAFLAGLSALLLALSHGQAWGWASPAVLALVASAAAALLAFTRVESRARAPMVDVALLRNRAIFSATASALLNYVCLNAAMFLVPFYLQHFRGVSPSDAGVLLAAQALAMALVAPFSGTLSDRIGSRGPATLGMAVTTVGILLLATLDADASRFAIAGRLALLGVGSGLFAAPNNSAMLGAAPRERHGVAAALLGSGRYIGMVLGVAVAGAVFTRTLAHEGGSFETGMGFMTAFRATLLVIALFGLAATVLSLSRGARGERD